MKNNEKLGGSQKMLPRNCNYDQTLEFERLAPWVKRELVQIFNQEDEQISIKDAVAALKTENFVEMHKAIISLRKTLFVQMFQQLNKKFDQTEFIAQTNEFVPTIFYFIEHGRTEILKLEAAWIISILALGSSDITKLIIENGIIRLALIVLHKGSRMLTMRMIQILGLLAGSSVKYRDSILQACDMSLIISKMEPQYEQTYIWCLANLCIGRPSPKFNLIQPALKIFSQVIMQKADQNNKKMINDALFALRYLIDGESNRIDILIDNGVIPQLIKLLPYCNVVSILRIFEGIFYGTEDQIKYLLDCGFISLVRSILDPKSRENMGDMMQTFAANETLFEVLSNQNFLLQLFKSLSEDNSNLRADALDLIWKAISNGTNEEANHMVKHKLIPYLIKMLDVGNQKQFPSIHLKKGIEILSKVLRKGEIRVNDKKENKYFTIFEQTGGIAIIQKLLSSKQDDVAKYASLFKQEFNK